jgi:hypothetical protein
VSPYFGTGARLSDCGAYRYTLTRRWANDGPTATFIMLNPSTADAEQDDPTIRRCLGFAKALGCGRLIVGNLYAYRATKPADLWLAADPVGPDNDATLAALADTDGPLIAAWGINAKPARVGAALTLLGPKLTALGVTKQGAPRHPLYLPGTVRPTPFDPQPTDRVMDLNEALAQAVEVKR